MQIVCLDLEGVLVPEIWIEFSQRTQIPELSKTTRDEPNYDKLMRERTEILNRHRLGLSDIQNVIGGMCPIPGAREFLNELRKRMQVVILSDTFYEFASPLMAQLDWPTLFCHHLEVNASGYIADYHLRIPDHKRASVAAFNTLNFNTIAVGDSYNDISMLSEAHTGIFFCPPANVIADFPQFRVKRSYNQLLNAIDEASAKN
ncbi:bifunctional phosphoserine phosphatase/homoserine phosphotransferase ThrH [Herbaspirillum sp. ST 5-3]|uniref:bifunctional phosphoserine phosphatase/homoserine phosphotransferase ThrH n=1 Tax=Oxalobacteraceae TaxID=75682 RepID=UPI0010A3AE98|nr:bifunctional phosphoserine phosphatase/homoserine phosphotransferase ThrH [Herbaspirillum sp. ST 5-3]